MTMTTFKGDAGLLMTNRRILVIDDSPENRGALCALLRQMQLKVGEISSGAEALSVVSHFRPDLVLLDVKMPGMSGIEVLERLNVNSHPYEVIMMTGHESIDDACRAMELGATSYLRKPIQYAELVEHVSLALKKVVEFEQNIEKELTYKRELKDHSIKLREAFKLTETQSRRFDLILDSMYEPLLAVDCEERIMMVNKAAGIKFSITIGTALGCGLAKVIHDVNLLAGIRSLIHESELKPDHPVSMLIQYDTSLFNTSSSALIDARKILAGYVLVFNDITEGLRAEKIRNAFLHLVSHEFRTPLSIILNSNSLLEMGGNSKLVSRELHANIESSCQRLGLLTDNIIRFARILNTTLTLSVVETDMKKLASDTIAAYRSAAAEKRTGIILHCSAESPVFPVDKDILAAGLHCIIDNAVKYTRPGSEVIVTLEQVAVNERNHFRITIRDHGEGIDQDKIAGLFEWFRQGENPLSRKHEGLGLGLPIARQAIDRLGGTINLESDKGQGSRVIITIPENCGISREHQPIDG